MNTLNLPFILSLFSHQCQGKEELILFVIINLASFDFMDRAIMLEMILPLNDSLLPGF